MDGLWVRNRKEDTECCKDVCTCHVCRPWYHPGSQRFVLPSSFCLDTLVFLSASWFVTDFPKCILLKETERQRQQWDVLNMDKQPKKETGINGFGSTPRWRLKHVGMPDEMDAQSTSPVRRLVKVICDSCRESQFPGDIWLVSCCGHCWTDCCALSPTHSSRLCWRQESVSAETFLSACFASSFYYSYTVCECWGCFGASVFICECVSPQRPILGACEGVIIWSRRPFLQVVHVVFSSCINKLQTAEFLSWLFK